MVNPTGIYIPMFLIVTASKGDQAKGCNMAAKLEEIIPGQSWAWAASDAECYTAGQVTVAVYDEMTWAYAWVMQTGVTGVGAWQQSEINYGMNAEPSGQTMTLIGAINGWVIAGEYQT